MCQDEAASNYTVYVPPSAVIAIATTVATSTTTATVEPATIGTGVLSHGYSELTTIVTSTIHLINSFICVPLVIISETIMNP